MSFLKVCPQAAWETAPHLIAKNLKCEYRTTIDLHPVNAASEAEQWSISIIQAKCSNFIGSKHITFLDFYLSYWQFPLEP